MAMSSLSPAATDLGLGGQLVEQVKNQTEEERKRKLAQQRAAQLSPGAMSLLGPSMGLTGGG